VNEPPIISASPKARFPIWLIGGVPALLVFALICGGFVYWLLRGRTPSSTPILSRAPATFVDMFNARDLEGWDFDPAVWTVRDGVICGRQKGAGPSSVLFWRDSNVADFELHFFFRLIRGNSGVNYRSTRLAGFDVGGYEFEIYTNKSGNLANLGTDRQRYRLYRADDSAEPIDSEWHEGIAIANGTRLIHMLDGKTLCDVRDTNPVAPRTGVIALGMTPGTIVEFKELRLKRLNASP
jgi:hypothetical protein